MMEMEAHAIGGQIVRLFPSVKKFELILCLLLKRNMSIQEINEMLTPYQNLDLEEASVRCDNVSASSVMVAVLENAASWKGVKNVHFRHACIMQDDFSASIQNLILHSKGFKSVKICGNALPEILEVVQPILEESGAPIHVTGGVVLNQVRY